MAGGDETVALLRRWQGGDREALLELLARDRDWVETAIRSGRGPVLRALEETGDGVQELMLRALAYVPRFLVANREQFRALLTRMIRNLLVDRARAAHRQPRPQTVSEADAVSARLSMSPAHEVTPPAAAAERAEELGWMRLGLEFLPPDERRIVLMRSFEELEFAAIGEVIGAAANATRMRYKRALLKLAGIVERLQRGELDALLEQPDE